MKCVHGNPINGDCGGKCEHGVTCGRSCAGCSEEYGNYLRELCRRAGEGDEEKGRSVIAGLLVSYEEVGSMKDTDKCRWCGHAHCEHGQDATKCSSQGCGCDQFLPPDVSVLQEPAPDFAGAEVEAAHEGIRACADKLCDRIEKLEQGIEELWKVVAVLQQGGPRIG